MKKCGQNPFWMAKMALAHVRPTGSTWEEHDLLGHLEGTAQRAREFADAFGNGDWARLAGLWHDLGKFPPAWQAYLKGKSGFDPEAHLEGNHGKLDHSSAGAQHAIARLGPMGQVLAYLIAGHHAGLPDWSHETGGSLKSRLEKRECLDAIQSHIPTEILNGAIPQSRPCVTRQDDCHLWIRMLFSCLVDADFLDTEAFMDPEKADQRPSGQDLAALKARFDAYMIEKQEKAQDTPVNRIRAEVLKACREGANQTPGLFSLTVPTGGGKTLASMAFALEHALAKGKRRIIVVIPYTSIIEQTAKVFRDVFGEGVVLEHHSNLDIDKESQQSRLAAENWDAPVIVTTNVQLFESLFAARTSSCRKLHNIAESVVILDEAQMLPPEYLQPILGVLNALVEGYKVSALLCTATQPALVGEIGSQKAKFKGLEGVRELMPDPGELSRQLQRVQLQPQHPELQAVSWEALAQQLQTFDQVLCIVNTRRDCRELFQLMPPGTIHLSALMCAEHRSEVIERIKGLLSAGQSARVISTQLVEAGVDLDFPVVFRALAGLDSLAQAAGRCNREGKLNADGRLGQVFYFRAPKDAPTGLMLKGQQACEESLRCDLDAVQNLSPQAFTRYFKRFYADVTSFDSKGMHELLEKDIASGKLYFQFRTAALKFKLIDDQAQCAVVVLYGPQKEAIERLLEDVRILGPSRERLRKLQRCTVNIPERDFKALQSRGEILEVGGLWAQAVDGLYHDDLGFCPQGAPWNPETLVL